MIFFVMTSKNGNIFTKTLFFIKITCKKRQLAMLFLVFPTQVAYVSRLAYGVNAAIALM